MSLFAGLSRPNICPRLCKNSMGGFVPINGKSRTLRSVSKERNPGRFGRRSFQPGHFGLSRLSQLLGCVVSALVGGSFRPNF